MTETKTAKTFDTGLYFVSHLREPRGRGNWAFARRPAVLAARANGELPEGIEWRNDLYSAAKKSLPGGHWVVLP